LALFYDLSTRVEYISVDRLCMDAARTWLVLVAVDTFQQLIGKPVDLIGGVAVLIPTTRALKMRPSEESWLFSSSAIAAGNAQRAAQPPGIVCSYFVSRCALFACFTFKLPPLWNRTRNEGKDKL
jgi:hypothetical protein